MIIAAWFYKYLSPFTDNCYRKHSSPARAFIPTKLNKASRNVINLTVCDLVAKVPDSGGETWGSNSAETLTKDHLLDPC